MPTHSIRAKYRRLLLIVCGAAILLACMAYFIYEIYAYRQNALRHITVISRMVATNSTAAMAFSDEEAAVETLRALRAEQQIQRAFLFDTSGRVFACYPDDAKAIRLPKSRPASDYRFSFSGVTAVQPVMQEDMRLGTLYIHAGVQDLYTRFALFFTGALGIMAGALVLAWVLAGRMQQRLFRPVDALAATARQISQNHNYAARATRVSDDEMGDLTDAFNKMLTEIDRQNGEITKLNQHLEHKVEERTRELALANKELETFSYSVSHDLQAPLRHITFFAEALQKKQAGNLDDDGKLYLSKISANASRMSQLIRDILSFSRVSRETLNKEWIDMNALVAEVVEERRRGEEHRKINITVHPLPPCPADKTLLLQVWENLLGNAIKYTRQKEEAVIDVSGEESSREVTYRISDNGAGFSMEFYEKLFTPFERLHAPRHFEGTGVGLAIVQRIVQRHGGRIWAEGEEGKGATFYVALPREEEDHGPGVTADEGTV